MRRLLPSLLVAIALVAGAAGTASAAPPTSDAPTGLRVTGVTASSVTLAWDAVRRASAYQVLRGSPGAPLSPLAEVGGTSHVDTGLEAGRAYVYAVASVSKKTTSDPSDTVTVRTVPAPPATLAAVVTAPDAVRLDWSAATGASGYHVWRSTGNGPFVTVGTLGGVVTEPGGAVPTPPTTWTDTGLAPSTTYRYAVRSFNESGTSPDSQVASATTPDPAPPFDGFAPHRAFATGSWAESVVAADVNGDGRDEAVVATRYYFDAENDYSLFVHNFVPGTAGPTVTRVATGNGYTDSAAAAAADLDGDGTDDVLLATDAGVKVFSGSTSGLRPPTTVAAGGAVSDVVTADLTGDGVPDVLAAVKSPNGGVAVLLANRGDGTFSPAQVLTVPRTGPPVLAVGDFTADGHDDVAVLWSGRVVEVLVDFGLMAGQAPGNWDTFATTQVGTSWSPDSIAVGDVTGDGYGDVLVTVAANSPNSVLVVLPRSPSARFAPQFALASYDIPEPVVVADVDRDGRNDVVVAHGGWNAVGLYQQQVGGGLAAEQRFTVPYASHYSPRGLAVGDVTGDGRPDVMLADYNHGLVLLAGR